MTQVPEVYEPAAPESALAECTEALRELALAAEHYRLVVAAYLGLTFTDSQAVSYLSRGAMEQHELAVSMEMTPGSISSVIDRLVAHGFVERLPHPTDRRRTIVRISAAGAERLAEARSWLDDAFEPVPAERRAGAAVVLRQLADGLRVRALAVPPRPAGVPGRRRRR